MINLKDEGNLLTFMPSTNFVDGAKDLYLYISGRADWNEYPQDMRMLYHFDHPSGSDCGCPYHISKNRILWTHTFKAVYDKEHKYPSGFPNLDELSLSAIPSSDYPSGRLEPSGAAFWGMIMLDSKVRYETLVAYDKGEASESALLSACSAYLSGNWLRSYIGCIGSGVYCPSGDYYTMVASGIQMWGLSSYTYANLKRYEEQELRDSYAILYQMQMNPYDHTLAANPIISGIPVTHWGDDPFPDFGPRPYPYYGPENIYYTAPGLSADMPSGWNWPSGLP